MLRRTFVQGAALVAASAIPCAIPCAFAFKAGADYVELESPIQGAEGLLIKLFSYDCPFCYKYDVAVDPELRERIRETGLRFAP